MAPPRDPSSDDALEGSSASAKLPEGFEKIVDELRNVLSALGNAENPPSGLDPLLNDDEMLRSAPPSISPNDIESEKLGEAAFRQASEPSPSSSPQPSDAEFWNGNVLGWSASSAAEPPTNQMFSEPLPADPWLTPSASDLPQVFNSDEKITPPPVEPEFSLPPAPVPPENDEKMEIDLGSFGQFGTPDPVPPPPPQMEKKEIDPRNDFMEKLRIPVPETIHQTQQPVKIKKNDMILEEMSIKPSDHIQLACLYPDGQEKLANEFILKMKTAAAKAAGIPEIQVVLSTPWFLNQINISAWKKAASMSGAHFLIVLGFRKDKENFKDLSKVIHHEDVKSRLILIEQINLQALYADLLSDVMRNFNAQG